MCCFDASGLSKGLQRYRFFSGKTLLATDIRTYIGKAVK